MWTKNKRPRAQPEMPKTEEKDRGKGDSAIRNLDARLRRLEGKDSLTAFYEAANLSDLPKALMTAKEEYKNRSQGKGKPHPDGHEAVTLTSTFLQWINDNPLPEGFEAEFPRRAAAITMIHEHQKVVGGQDLNEQRKALSAITHTLKEPEEAAPHCHTFTCRKTKKEDKILVVLGLGDFSILRNYVPIIRAYVIATGGEIQTGGPPPGPMFHKKGKVKDEDEL